MILSVRSEGSGSPLVILHGLFGSGDNWRSVAGAFAARFTTVTVDLRNHGSSGHDSSMSYLDMARDVAETLDDLGIEAAHLLGHSMGGKVAMRFAIDRPQRTLSLVVVDIAPKRYPAHHRAILETLPALDSAGARSRKEADSLLSGFIADAAVRALLLKSVRPDDNGIYRWTLNAGAIVRDYETISGWPHPEGVYEGPVLYIRAGLSDYVSRADVRNARRWFPAAEEVEIPDAGHWVHAEQRDSFCDRVDRFLASNG